MLGNFLTTYCLSLDLCVLRVFQRGSLPYQSLSVPEHSSPGTVVGNVTGAVDADEGSNAIVYYFIAGADTTLNHKNEPVLMHLHHYTMFIQC